MAATHCLLVRPSALQDCHIKCQGRNLKLRAFFFFFDYVNAKSFDHYVLCIEIWCELEFWLKFQIWLFASDTNSETKKMK